MLPSHLFGTSELGVCVAHLPRSMAWVRREGHEQVRKEVCIFCAWLRRLVNERLHCLLKVAPRLVARLRP